MNFPDCNTLKGLNEYSILYNRTVQFNSYKGIVMYKIGLRGSLRWEV